MAAEEADATINSGLPRNDPILRRRPATSWPRACRRCSLSSAQGREAPRIGGNESQLEPKIVPLVKATSQLSTTTNRRKQQDKKESISFILH